MRVEIKIDPKIGEPIVVIHAPKPTPELMALAETLAQTGEKPSLLFVKKDTKLASNNFMIFIF